MGANSSYLATCCDTILLLWQDAPPCNFSHYSVIALSERTLQAGDLKGLNAAVIAGTDKFNQVTFTFWFEFNLPVDSN